MQPPDYVHALMAMGKTQIQISKATGIRQPSISKLATGESETLRKGGNNKLKAYYQKEMANKAKRDKRAATRHDNDAHSVLVPL